MKNLLPRGLGRRWVPLLIITTLGCGGSDPESKLTELNPSNLQRVTNLYFTYQKMHRFQGPPDDQAFKKFVRDFNPRKLERIGVDTTAIDDVFVSERDGKPFKIRYGVVGSAMGSQEPVVFEAEGVGDARLVGFLNLTHREVEGVEYDRLWTGQGVSSQPARDSDRQ